MTDDFLAAALSTLSDEVSAVAAFDRARDAVVDLIEAKADANSIFQALGEIYERLAVIRTAYYALEALMVANTWTMQRPDDLPPTLRAAIQAQVYPHQQHLARTALAERVIGSWLAQQNARRNDKARRHTEQMHVR